MPPARPPSAMALPAIGGGGVAASSSAEAIPELEKQPSEAVLTDDDKKELLQAERLENVRATLLVAALLGVVLTLAEAAVALDEASPTGSFEDVVLVAAASLFYVAMAALLAVAAQVDSPVFDISNSGLERTALAAVVPPLLWLGRAVVGAGVVEGTGVGGTVGGAATGSLVCFAVLLLAILTVAGLQRSDIYHLPVPFTSKDLPVRYLVKGALVAAAASVLALLAIFVALAAQTAAGDVFPFVGDASTIAGALQLAQLVLALLVPVVVGVAVAAQLGVLPGTVFLWTPEVGAKPLALLLFKMLVGATFVLYVLDAVEAVSSAALSTAAERALVLPFCVSLLPVAALQSLRPLSTLWVTALAFVTVLCVRVATLFAFRAAVGLEVSEEDGGRLLSAGAVDAVVCVAYVGGAVAAAAGPALVTSLKLAETVPLATPVASVALFGGVSSALLFPAVSLSLAEDVSLPDLLSFGFGSLRASLNTLQAALLLLQAVVASYTWTLRKRVEKQRLEQRRFTPVEEQRRYKRGRNVSKMVDRTLHREYQGDEQVHKLLLLGDTESRDSLFKLFQRSHGDSPSDEELTAAKQAAHDTVLRSMGTLVRESRRKAAEGDDKCGVSAENEAHAQLVTEAERSGVLTTELARSVAALWQDGGIQRTYEARHEFKLAGSAAHFVAKAEEISGDGWVPPEEDRLRVQRHTAGVVELNFTIDGHRFTMYDVAGQRNERRKWLHQFDGMTAIIYVTPLSDYDNGGLKEALDDFEKLVGMRGFEWISFILLLSKGDVFAEKVQSIPLSDHFEEYEGPDGDWEDAADYIEGLFRERFPDLTPDVKHGRELFAHTVCLSDTSLTEVVFKAVKDIDLRRFLLNGGL